MSKIRLSPIGFWSYARQDDELSQGKLSTLRSLLMFELQQQYGRDPIQIFQDASTIPHGAAWEQEIRAALGKSTFFIPIVTPNFIQSEWCCREVAIFLEREAQLHEEYPDLPRRSRMFPIQFVDINEVDPADDSVLEALQSLQWFDFRRFRHRSYESEPVREAISELAASMRELLHIKVEDPAVARERARIAAEQEERTRREAEEKAARARQEAEAEAARAREQEARERREAARQRAEEARLRAEEAAEAARKRAEEAAEAARLQAAQAVEAARILAEEETAAERARAEAELAAQRLTSADQAAAERSQDEIDASLERARRESESAERERIALEAAAEKARLESEALAERERVLAEQAAAAAAETTGLTFADRPVWKRPVAIAGVATAALAALLVYLVWPALPDSPAKADQPTAPVTSTTKAATDDSTTESEAYAWLNGQWGLDGDCSLLVTISARPGGLWVEFDNEGRAHVVRSATGMLVVTDRARYTRTSSTEVSVSEAAAAGRNDYGLERCGP